MAKGGRQVSVEQISEIQLEPAVGAAVSSRTRPNRDSMMDVKLHELSIDERIKLVEDLWDSIAADQRVLPLTADQKDELDRRLDAYAIDKNRGRLASDVIAEIRRRL